MNGVRGKYAPGHRKSKIDHRSRRRFSTGVPVRATRARRRRPVDHLPVRLFRPPSSLRSRMLEVLRAMVLVVTSTKIASNGWRLGRALCATRTARGTESSAFLVPGSLIDVAVNRLKLGAQALLFR